MTPQQIKDNKPDGATHYCGESFYRYNQVERKHELYMQGIGWVGVMLGSSTKIKPL